MGTGGGFGTDGGFGSDDFDDGSYPADGSKFRPRGDAKGRKTAAEMVDEAQASPPDMNRRGACPVIALQTLPANGGIVALVGSFGSAAARRRRRGGMLDAGVASRGRRRLVVLHSPRPRRRRFVSARPELTPVRDEGVHRDASVAAQVLRRRGRDGPPSRGAIPG